MTTDSKTTYHDNGQIKEITISSGGDITTEGWYDNGQIKFRRLNDPLINVLNKTGRKFHTYEWHENGQKKKRHSSEESMIIWYENGQKKEEWIQDNDINKTFTQTKWFKDA